MNEHNAKILSFQKLIIYFVSFHQILKIFIFVLMSSPFRKEIRSLCIKLRTNVCFGLFAFKRNKHDAAMEIYIYRRRNVYMYNII